jgi:ubiquinone/menaquinone biosynthesis C-methylase UbiE/CheY-like chemotaxis protein
MTQPESGTQATAEKHVVLIVDDDLSYLEKLQRVLREHYAVYATTSGIEAIKLIKALPDVHVLIVNEDLPRMKGTELLRFLHEMFGKSDAIIKILLTDSTSNGTFADLASYGRIDYTCAKPADPAEIRHKVGFLIAQRSHEKRTSMRVNLNGLSDIRIETGGPGEARVVNLSENGMFLQTMAYLPEGASIPLTITLPDGRHYPVSGRIVRQDIDQGGVGVEFQAIDDQGRSSILQFLADYVTVRDLSELKLRYPFLNTDEMVLFSDTYKIEFLIREAMKAEIEVAVIHAQARNPEILKFADLRPPSTCALKGEGLTIKFKTSDLIFISFQIGYATYNFETMISRIATDGAKLVCLYPRVMFYSEKRTEKRISPYGNLRIEIPLSSPFNSSITGRVTDISPGGVSFVADSHSQVLLKGTPLETLSILNGDKLLWKENGEVRYVARAGEGTLYGMKYGIQFGIGRVSIQSVQAPVLDYEHSDEGPPGHLIIPPGPSLVAELNKPVHRPPEVLRIENRRGEEIVGLLNSSLSLDEKPVPVVVVPPAFGKTKEVLFGLALTLIQNFRALGKPLAVIRYDGIRRKGESYKDPDASEPPYEMLKASTSQGAEDIRTVLDWLQLNSKLKASSIILVTFSLSALEARVVLRDDFYRRQIDYWISCMGSLEFRDMMNRVNCGLDVLEQYQLGIKLGIYPILGNLICHESYAADVIANSVGTLEQAREDMRHLDLPITWIYGQYDQWVKSEFIRDVMSVQANALREVIGVPIGHNARTSQEALRLFGTITSLIHRFLHKTMIQPILPSKKNMEILRRAEKDRLPPRNLKNRKTYWHHYLVGENNLLGFDIMAMSDDYQQLMEDQLQALELQSTDRLLDLGGGTGNFVEHLLESGRDVPAQMTIADLILDAMKQARKKLLSRYNLLNDPGRLDFLGLDLEMSRFLPVRRFLEGEVGSFEEMADKIENLTLESALKIQEAYSPRLHRILRGEPISPSADDLLKRKFDLHEYRIIVDFNQAARYVRRLSNKKPAFRRLVLPGFLEGNLHLPFKAGWYNKVLMSLVLSYVFDPAETLREVRRIIRPGGRLVLSSMRPDTDSSGPFTRLLEKIETMPEEALPPDLSKTLLLDSLRSFLNDAQALSDLEEAGTFDFFDPEKLEGILEEGGWDLIRRIPSFGDPPQGYVVVAKVRDTHA